METFNVNYKWLRYLIPILVLIFAIFSSLVINRATWFVQDKHLSLLADSFIKNDLFLNPINLPQGDFADYKGKQYLFFGPFPSVLLVPFVYVWGKNFPQITLSFSSLVVTFLAIFLLSKKLKFDNLNSFWLSNFFVFGTVFFFVGLVNISAYVVQAVGTTLIALSLLEYFTKRRWLLIGILVGAAGATRTSLYALVIFYLVEIYRNRKDLKINKVLISLFIPILISMTIYGLYNFRRFHNVFDTGYTRNVSELDKSWANNKIGFFNLSHLPSKLYLMLIKSPEPVGREGLEFVLKFPYLKADGLGMAIWFTSPLLIYLVRVKKKDYTGAATIAIFALAFPSLIYSGPGSSQYGYRYSLDFMPLLFLVLTSAFEKGLPPFAKFLIAFGIVFNAFYMLSIWNSYPLLSFWEYF